MSAPVLSSYCSGAEPILRIRTSGILRPERLLYGLETNNGIVLLQQGPEAISERDRELTDL